MVYFVRAFVIYLCRPFFMCVHPFFISVLITVFRLFVISFAIDFFIIYLGISLCLSFFHYLFSYECLYLFRYFVMAAFR